MGRFVLLTGQIKKPYIVAMIQEACAHTGRNGVRVEPDEVEIDTTSDDRGDLGVGELGPDESPIAVEKAHVAVSEHSHPDKSQPARPSDKAIQQLVDRIRDIKSALETTLIARLPCAHPVMA